MAQCILLCDCVHEKHPYVGKINFEIRVLFFFFLHTQSHNYCTYTDEEDEKWQFYLV